MLYRMGVLSFEAVILITHLPLFGRYARLDGSTNRVQRMIDISQFQKPDSPLFIYILNTRAGGLGVNLQTADTCILYDSDWCTQHFAPLL